MIEINIGRGIALQYSAVRIRILKPMTGRLGKHDLSRFTPILVYDVDNELGERLIEMGTAIADRTGAPAVVVQPKKREG